MALPKSGPNSSAPTTGAVVAGVYNATVPVLVDGQACAIQLDVNGQVKTSGGGGGGGSDVNITGINGSAPAVAVPLFVRLSDGTQALGTDANPIRNSPSTTAANQPITAASLPLPLGASTEATLALIKAKTDNLDVALSTRTKPADAQHTIIDSGTTAVTQATASNLHTAATLDAETTKVIGTVNLSAATTNVIGTVRVQGNVGGLFDAATAATAPANAIQAGMRGSTTVPTAVTDGQLVGARSDKYGNQVNVLNAPRDLIGTVMLNSASGSTVSFITAGATGVFNDIISLVITNETATATIVSLSDNGAAGTVYKFALAANGGIVVNFPTPLPQGTSAAAWQVFNSAAVACDYVAVFAKNK